MLTSLKAIYGGLRSLPAWMEERAEEMTALRRGVLNQGARMLAMEQMLREAVREHKSIVEQQDRLRAFVEAVEGAGIKRKFGGYIDVDFDRFVNAITDDDRDELAVILRARKAQNAKKTPREMTIDADPKAPAVLPKC